MWTFVWLTVGLPRNYWDAIVNGGPSVQFLNYRDLPHEKIQWRSGALSLAWPIMSNWWQTSEVNAFADVGSWNFHGLMSTTTKELPRPPFASPFNLRRQFPGVSWWPWSVLEFVSIFFIPIFSRGLWDFSSLGILKNYLASTSGSGTRQYPFSFAQSDLNSQSPAWMGWSAFQILIYGNMSCHWHMLLREFWSLVRWASLN